MFPFYNTYINHLQANVPIWEHLIRLKIKFNEYWLEKKVRYNEKMTQFFEMGITFQL